MNHPAGHHPAGNDDLPGWLQPLHTAIADPDRVADLATARPVPAQPRRAAVLILFADDDCGPRLLFIERAHHLRAHPGQMAFPGGRYEPSDDDLTATALREAGEETGLEPSGVVCFGALPSVGVPVSGFDVTAVLGWWRRPSPVAAVDPGEVASVHRIPVNHLSDPDRRVQVRHPSGYRGPGFQVDDLLIWGMTAHLVDAVLDLGGWHRPWNRTRTVSAPGATADPPAAPDPVAPTTETGDDHG